MIEEHTSLEDASALSVRKINKSFGATKALQDVSMDFHAGEVHAILGLNGAGKSTLMKVLSGAILPDKGEIFLSGEKQHWLSTQDASKNGVGIVYQEFSLCGTLDVAENLFLGDFPVKERFFNCIQWKKIRQETERLLLQMGVKIPLDKPVDSLSIAQQQMVEIIKAVRQKHKVLIFDEPTSALSHTEIETLFKLIRRLRDEQTLILYITHRLDELPQIADRVSVMRNGYCVGTYLAKGGEQHEFVALMLGEQLHHQDVTKQQSSYVDTTNHSLEVNNLKLTKESEAINFTIKRGEILAIAGQIGSGRSHLLKTIFGFHRPLSGQVILEGEALVHDHQSNIRKGVGLVPEDRKLHGIFPGRSVKENILLSCYHQDRKSRYFISPQKDLKQAAQTIASTTLSPPDPHYKIESLSGGNQQKAVFGRWYGFPGLRFLILDEPTRGVDVGARQQIYDLIQQLAARGIPVLVASSDAEEILTLCHRVLIISQRKIVQECTLTELDILTLNKHIIGV